MGSKVSRIRRRLPHIHLNTSRLRGATTSAAIVLGVGATLAVFIFQTVQAWVSERPRPAAIQWLTPTTSTLAFIGIIVCLYLMYWLLRTRRRVEPSDPYRAFVDGILEYGKALHDEKRDPALLRLRDNASLTLHVLGFHQARVTLGAWALESAQFVDDKLAIISILIDDLGWANYLLGQDSAIINIEKAIRFGEQLPGGLGDPKKSLLLAKAYRHLGVIKTAEEGTVREDEFREARRILIDIEALAPHDVRVDLAHLSHAQALAIASMLGVNISGVIRRGDTEGAELLRTALGLVRTARDVFREEGDQGRYAKSLVLEVRLLEALRETDEAQQLSPVRDRAVAASVWARPAGAAFITGR